ncbi:MAG: AMP-binding protein [Pseudomonadota bacterium]
MREPIDVLRLYPPHAHTLNSLLESRASVAGAREFLVFGSSSVSYAEALDRVARTVALLAEKGVGAGDRVGVMSTNHPSTVFLFLALARLGAVMVGINPDYGIEEARYVLSHAEVCGVVCAPEALETVRAACGSAASQPWLMLNEPGDPGVPVFAEVLFAARPAVQPAPDDANATCVFIYTSGTTGFPKGVMHNQRNVVMAGEGFVERMHLQPEDRLLCILPMFHVNAICYSLAGALAAGATLILEPRFSASKFWQTVKQHGATEVNTIAAVTGILLRRPRSEYVPGHNLRKIYGAPFDEETYVVFKQEFSVPTLIEGYGMSEIPGVLNNPYDGPHKIRSMGKPSLHPDPAVCFAEMRVVDESGNPVADGQTGELVVRTPIAMQGYFRDPEQTAAAFRDGWFLTGDLGWRDADGYFWFIARKKDIIRKRGENISGAELDRVIGSHPDVINVAAIAVPSALGEDDILAVVVPRPEASLCAADIALWCRERLAPIKVPRYVVFTDALPLTPTHRVAKFKLRDDHALIARAIDLEKK